MYRIWESTLVRQKYIEYVRISESFTVNLHQCSYHISSFFNKSTAITMRDYLTSTAIKLEQKRWEAEWIWLGCGSRHIGQH